MKRVLIFIVLLVANILIYAQQKGPNISWDATTYNFGDVKEEGGKVSHKFIFTNTGSEPVVINNVRPSCGCTTLDYTKAPVPPGGKGFVTAAFDPRRRVGKNSKSVTVTTNTTPSTTILRFTVNVLPKPRTLEDDYPRVMGELRLKTNHLALMKIKDNDIKEGKLDIVNTQDHDLTIGFKNVPPYIQIEAVPSTLKPKQKGQIRVKYDAHKKGDYGFLLDRIPVSINGNTNNNRYSISISATIVEDFSKLTPQQLAKAPKIEFEQKTFNFDTITRGEIINHVFKFKNTGKSDLIIRKTKASCGCTIVEAPETVIKPGKKGELKVRFNSAGKRNRQNKSITVITNSPSMSQVVLRITGFVKEPNTGNQK